MTCHATSKQGRANFGETCPGGNQIARIASSSKVRAGPSSQEDLLKCQHRLRFLVQNLIQALGRSAFVLHSAGAVLMQNQKSSSITWGWRWLDCIDAWLLASTP